MEEHSFFNFDAAYGDQYESTIRKVFPAYDHLYEMMNALLQVKLEEISELLIIGAGGGMELVTFGTKNPKWTFTGVDPSERMVQFAQKKVKEAGVEERVKLITGKVEELTEVHKYDGASCVLVLHFIPDNGAKLSMLENIANRLKPGAPFIVVSINGEPASSEFQTYLTALRRLMINVNRMNSTEAEAVLQNALKEMHFSPRSRMEELLQIAGFEYSYHFFADLQFDGWIAFKKEETSNEVLNEIRKSGTS